MTTDDDRKDKRLRQEIHAETKRKREEKKRAEYEKLRTPVWMRPGADDVDYELCLKMECWSIEEGVALLLGKNPKIVTNSEVMDSRLISDADIEFKRQYDAIMESAFRSVNIERLKEFNTPQNFIQWAKDRNITIPGDLEANIQPNSTSCDKLTLIKIIEPQRQDDWFNCIRDCVKEFEADHKRTPNEAQLWGRLISNPPTGYEVQSETIKKKPVLQLSGVPMDRETFKKRYKVYYPTDKP